MAYGGDLADDLLLLGLGTSQVEQLRPLLEDERQGPAQGGDGLPYAGPRLYDRRTPFAHRGIYEAHEFRLLRTELVREKVHMVYLFLAQTSSSRVL